MIRHLLAIALAALALNAFAAVDVNKASQAELETVKGIGPGLSTKILDARKTGPFKDWNDMVDRVQGIGSGNAARFSEAGLTVGGTPFTKAADGKPAAKSQAGTKTAAAAPARSAKPAQ